MKYSSKMERCGLSPMRKFNGEAAKAVENGKKIYHLNIGQPDIVTPAAYFDALKAFAQPVLAYAPSPGVGELLDAVRGLPEDAEALAEARRALAAIASRD